MAILLQFWSIKPRFVRKCSPEATNGNFTAVFGDRTSFRAKLPDNLQITILPQFLAIEPHFVRKGSPDNLNDQTSFRAKRLRPDARNRNFTAVFRDRTSFRAKGLRPDSLRQIAIFLQFLRKGCDRMREIAILLQFLAIEPHFVRKGCDRMREIAILLQFFAIEPHVARIL